MVWLYEDMKHVPEYGKWIRFQFPFCWTNIISALDSLSLIGLPEEDSNINFALKWIIEHQENDGL